MTRCRVPWVLSLALMAGGGLLAHALAYRFAASGSGSHAHGAAAGHGYLAYWPMCVAVCGAVAVVALVVSAVMRVRTNDPWTAPIWLFAILPPVGFVVQEHLERVVATGAFPYAVALQQTFVVGLVLQLPFALAAYLAARALIAFAVAVAKRYGGRQHRRRRSGDVPRRRSVWLAAAPISALALGHGERGPPSAVL